MKGKVSTLPQNVFIIESFAYQLFNFEDGILRIHAHLTLSRVSDQRFGVGEGDDARRGSIALLVGHDLDGVVLQDGYARVVAPEVDAQSEFPHRELQASGITDE